MGSDVIYMRKAGVWLSHLKCFAFFSVLMSLCSSFPCLSFIWKGQGNLRKLNKCSSSFPICHLFPHYGDYNCVICLRLMSRFKYAVVLFNMVPIYAFGENGHPTALFFKCISVCFPEKHQDGISDQCSNACQMVLF